MNDYWISTEKFTGFITIDNGIIVDAAPVMFKFVGQPVKNLTDWLRSKPQFGSMEIEEL